MATIRIKDVPPLDGEYELDISRFTNGELHLVKQLSGVRVGELSEALEARDIAVLTAFAVIALERAGRRVQPEQLFQADTGQITYDFTEDAEEVEERPPASPPPNGAENSSGGGDSPNVSSGPSGSTSSDTGDNPGNGLNPIGSPGSGMSVTSAPLTSAS